MEIKKISLLDYQEILALTKKNDLDILNEKEWKSLWLDNPYYNDVKGEWTIGWKAVSENKIVGVTLNIPFIFLFNGQKYLAAVCNNYVVDKEHRNISLNLRYHFLNQQKVDLCITNSANNASEKIMEAFKARKIEQYDYQNRLIYLINKKKVILNSIKNFNFEFRKIPIFLQSFFNKKNKEPKKKFSFEIINNFDDDFKNLDSKLSKSGKIFSSKDQNWLSWKYSKYIKTQNLITLKIYKEKTFLGFAVLIKNIEKKYNFKRLSLTELTLFDEEPLALRSIINHCLEIGKNINFDLVDVVGFNKKKRKELENIGFIKKKSENFNFLMKNNNKNLDKILYNDIHISDFSLTDGDGIFYL